MDGSTAVLNLTGDYTYLCAGYYRSQDLAAEGCDVHPTCSEVLDAYVVPLCLEKASLAGMQIPDFYVTNDYFEPPVVIDPVNPFMDRQRVALKGTDADSVARSLTRNYTYAMCCQTLPENARLTHFRSVLGWSSSVRYRILAGRIWETFGIPLASIRVMVLDDGTVLFSRIKPLPLARLSSRERDYLEARITWRT